MGRTGPETPCADFPFPAPSFFSCRSQGELVRALVSFVDQSITSHGIIGAWSHWRPAVECPCLGSVRMAWRRIDTIMSITTTPTLLASPREVTFGARGSVASGRASTSAVRASEPYITLSALLPSVKNQRSSANRCSPTETRARGAGHNPSDLQTAVVATSANDMPIDVTATMHTPNPVTDKRPAQPRASVAGRASISVCLRHLKPLC